MNRIQKFAIVLVMVALAPVASMAFAQPFTVDWSSVDGGGLMSSTGGTFSLAGTIGQPDAASNPALIGGTFELTGGFWPVANVCYCLGDLNHDGKKDGGDIQQFVNCVLVGGDCSCADVDQLNGVTPNDTDTFVAALLGANLCP